MWVIRGIGPEKSTGCCESDIEGAERELARVIGERYEPPKTGGDLKRTSIADVVNVYLKEHAPKTARPKNVAYLAQAILDWWDDKYLSDIKASTCEDYVKWRTAQPRKKRRSGTVGKATARHELNLLSTAIGYFHANHGPLSAIPVVTMPAKSGHRIDYYLTRKEVAERIRAARKLGKCKHVVRALLIGVYSGTPAGCGAAVTLDSIDQRRMVRPRERNPAPPRRGGNGDQEAPDPVPHPLPAVAVAEALVPAGYGGRAAPAHAARWIEGL